ncbi:MAG: glutathione S-transferase family protein [Hyphomicrobiales bacterium]
MGMLVDGVWQDTWYDTKKSGGKFVRKAAQFRNWITADGSAGPSGKSGFKAEAGRYHLYVSLACPWAHRTLIFRKLKGLEDMISVDVVSPLMYDKGWVFDADQPEATTDRLFGSNVAADIYVQADPTYTGRVTVPILWDKQTNTIVSNESAEIIRMFNSAFDEIGATSGDFYPQALREEIDAINERVYHAVNNGVYKSGFATTQAAYEEAVTSLFEALDELEERLGKSRYLVGDTITEADWRLFTTLVRFDPVYVSHFKCNIRRISDYPNLQGFLRELYQWQGVADTVSMDHIKRHYYMSHETVNPTRIVPAGPVMDLTAPHGRDSLKAAA